MAKRLKSKQAKRLTKFEKQWRQIKKKRIRITKREFKQYYELVRKANKKLSSNYYMQKAFDTRKFTYSISHITTTSEFKKRMARVTEVLGRGYRKKSNLAIRQRLYSNLENVFDTAGASRLVTLFEQLADNELLEFFKENPDIERIAYESEEGLDRYVELVGMTLDKISNRLKVKYRRMNKYVD